MNRVFSIGSQLPGMYGFSCPNCREHFNMVSNKPGQEITFTCPRCKTALVLICAVDPNEPDEDDGGSIPIGPGISVRLDQSPA